MNLCYSVYVADVVCSQTYVVVIQSGRFSSQSCTVQKNVQSNTKLALVLEGIREAYHELS